MKETIKTEIFDKLINECKTLSKELDKVVCIFSVYEKSQFSETKNDKREDLINSIIEGEFFIDSEDILKYYPSLTTFYDTETDKTDIITRHQIIIDFLKEIGFNSNSLNFGYYNIENCSKIETTYISEYYKNVFIRVQPNLMITLVIVRDNYMSNKELKFFFNKKRILNEISNISTDDIKRDIKIDKILKVN